LLPHPLQCEATSQNFLIDSVYPQNRLMENQRDPSQWNEASYEQDFYSFDDPKDFPLLLSESNQYREASEHMLGIINKVVQFLFNHGYHKSPTLYGIAFAIGHPIIIATTMLEAARKTNVTKAAISKVAMDFLEQTGLPPSTALKTEMAKQTYKNTNGNRKKITDIAGD
jgi:hypothetical protein